MLDNYFEYTHKGKSRNKDLVEDIYTFKCGFNITYVVQIENHHSNIFIVKFYQKNHRDSDNRYSLLNSRRLLKRQGSSGATNFLTILNTILHIIIDIYKNNNKASFGFMGAPTTLELNPEKSKKKINEDGTVVKTKRYNTYGIYVKRYFAPKSFIHVEVESSSCYMIKSKKNKDLSTEDIEDFFESYIQNYC